VTKGRSLHDLANEQLDFADFMDLLDELREQNDRAAAIVLAAQLEDALRAAITSRLVPLNELEESEIFGSDGPLYSFASKIRIGFALGVYGSMTRADLGRIRRIRNAFAHCRKPVKFETPEIAAECAKLQIVKRLPPDDVSERPWPPEQPRNQYDASVLVLWSRLARCAAKYKWRPPERCPCLA
jgi:hypothetical protein